MVGRRLAAVIAAVALLTQHRLLQLHRVLLGRRALQDLHEQVHLVLHLRVVVADLRLQRAEPVLELAHAVLDGVDLGRATATTNTATTHAAAATTHAADTHAPAAAVAPAARQQLDSADCAHLVGHNNVRTAARDLRLGLVAALDLHQQRWLVAPELLVEELEVLVRRRYVGPLSEPIGVELPDEGADVVVLEVGRQDVSRERVRVRDDERVAPRSPHDAAVSRRRRHDLEEFGEEGGHVGRGDRVQRAARPAADHVAELRAVHHRLARRQRGQDLHE